jgi:hypothetical protein
MTRTRFYVGAVYMNKTTMREAPVPELAWKDIEAELADNYGGFTRYEATGSWAGETEPTRVYEVIASTPPRVGSTESIADWIADRAYQKSVLWTRENIEGEFTL